MAEQLEVDISKFGGIYLGLDKSNWARWTKQNIVANPFALENKDWVGFVIMTNGNET